MSRHDPDTQFPCCEHCDHYGAITGHFYPCGGPACVEAERQAKEREAAEADVIRFRAELRDRLDRCTDHDHGAAFGWLKDNHPDLVREALDETGAPS